MSQVNISFFNVNSDRRLEQLPGSTWPELIPGFRSQQIIEKVIAELGNNDILVFCEVDIGMTSTIKAYCDENSLWIKIGVYNLSTLAFRYLVISKFECTSFNVYPLTKSGFFTEDCQRPQAPLLGSEPSADFLAYKEDIFGDNFDKSVIRTRFTLAGKELDVWSCHLGLANSTKLAQTIKFRSLIEEHSIAKGIAFVCGGDFNSFDAASEMPKLYEQQIKAMESDKIKWCTSHLTCTFRAYPYDIKFKMASDERMEFDRLYNAPKTDGLYSEVVIKNFRTFCEAMYAKYGGDGVALDHCFANHNLQIEAKAIILGTMSDHFMVQATVTL